MSTERVESFTELYENTRAAMFDGDYETATRLIILLAVQLDETPVWWIGEHDEFDIASLVVGAYWHYTEWHGGQRSLEYRALSALGQIFSPGMTTGPEEGGELYAYEMLADLAQQEVAV